MSQEVGNLVVRIGMDSTGFQNGVSNLNRQMRVIQSEFKAATAGTGGFGTSLNDLRLKSDSLTKQVDVQQQKVDALRKSHEKAVQSTGENSKAAQNLEVRLNKSRAELGNMQAELDRTNKAIATQSTSWYSLSQSLNNVGSRFQKIGQKMSSVGKELSVKLTAPLVGLGALVMKASVDLESAFTGVIKTVDATEAQLEELKNGFIDMARRIPIATEELYGIGEAAGQLGIKTKNILGFSEVMAKLGVATNMSSDQAATALARLANITQMPQTQFDRLGATIVALGNNLATTESEIVEMGLRIAGAGSQIGLSEAQILAFAGSLSSVGISADAGGSAISKVMIEIANNAASGGQKLEQFASVAGMTSAQFKEAFEQDAATAIVAFVEGLDRISESGGNVFAILDEMGLSEIRVRDALLRAAGAGDLFRESLEIGNVAWVENIALNKEAELRFGTTASQLQLFKNNLELTSAAFGDALAPALVNILDLLNPIIEKFGELNEGTKTTVLIIGGIAAAAGPLLIIAGGVINAIGTIGTAIGGLIAIIGGLSGVMGIVSTAFTVITGPIGIAVAAIGGLIAVGVLVVKNWDDIKIKLAETWNFIKQTAGSVWDSIRNTASIAWNSITNILSSSWNIIRSTASSVWEGIKGSIVSPIQSARDTLNGIIISIKNAFANMNITIPKPKLPHISVATKYKTVGTVSVPYPDFNVSFYAKGTDFHPGGWAIVGEEGPELLNLPRGSQVIPNNKLDHINQNAALQVISRDNRHLESLIDKVILAIERRSGISITGPAVNVERVEFGDKSDMQAFAVEVRSILDM